MNAVARVFGANLHFHRTFPLSHRPFLYLLTMHWIQPKQLQTHVSTNNTPSALTLLHCSQLILQPTPTLGTQLIMAVLRQTRVIGILLMPPLHPAASSLPPFSPLVPFPPSPSLFCSHLISVCIDHSHVRTQLPFIASSLTSLLCSCVSLTHRRHTLWGICQRALVLCMK